MDDEYTLIRLSDTDEPSEGLSDTRYGLSLPPRRHTSLEVIEGQGAVFPNRSRDTRADVGFNALREFAGLDDFPALPTCDIELSRDQDWSWDD